MNYEGQTWVDCDSYMIALEERDEARKLAERFRDILVNINECSDYCPLPCEYILDQRLPWEVKE